MKKEILYSYLAGFIDADGCITVGKPYKNTPQYYALISAAQVVSPFSKKVMDLLKNTFGGTYIIKQLSGNRRDCFFWRISNRKAQFCAETLLPYLIIKQDKAKLLIEIQTRITKRQWMKKPIKKSTHGNYGKTSASLTVFKKGNPPPAHKSGCSCFRCTKISPKYNPKLPIEEKEYQLNLVNKMRALNKLGKN
ncbi:MAG: LAGLIDADG family homing endonuclease [Candidatus Izemoplasmatales bacterium]|jgi:hypothetical protein